MRLGEQDWVDQGAVGIGQVLQTLSRRDQIGGIETLHKRA